MSPQEYERLVKLAEHTIALIKAFPAIILGSWPCHVVHSTGDRMMGLHTCDFEGLPHDGYGEAITDCAEREDGTLWAGNGEYGTQVAFCPFCGFRAKVPPSSRQVWDDELRKLKTISWCPPS